MKSAMMGLALVVLLAVRLNAGEPPTVRASLQFLNRGEPVTQVHYGETVNFRIQLNPQTIPGGKIPYLVSFRPEYGLRFLLQNTNGGAEIASDATFDYGRDFSKFDHMELRRQCLHNDYFWALQSDDKSYARELEAMEPQLKLQRSAIVKDGNRFLNLLGEAPWPVKRFGKLLRTPLGPDFDDSIALMGHPKVSRNNGMDMPMPAGPLTVKDLYPALKSGTYHLTLTWRGLVLLDAESTSPVRTNKNGVRYIVETNVSPLVAHSLTNVQLLELSAKAALANP